MIIEIVVSVIIFYSSYRWYNREDNIEEVEEGRRYVVL